MGYKWVHSSAYSSIPPNAIVGGNDDDGAIIYVGRAQHEGDMLVCKVIPSKQIGFVSAHGAAIPQDTFEILCGQNLTWVKCYDHVIPDTAVLCGRTSLNQPVYIGRGHYEGHLIVGKISSVHRALFIPYRGAERRLDSYEILIEDRRSVAPGWAVITEQQSEKRPLTPPLPPPPLSPLSPLSAAPTLIPEKAYPYGYTSTASAPYPIDEKPPMYTPTPTPTPMSTAMTLAMPMPLPQPTPIPTPMSIPIPAEVAPPIMVVPIAQLQPAVIIPADTYQPASAATYVPASTYDPPPPYMHVPVPAPAPAPTVVADMWVSASGGYIPPNAVTAGHDQDMSTLLVCRAYHNGLLVPGKASPARGCAYIPDAGQEHHKSTFEVLMGNEKYRWVPAYSGGTAAGAVEAGRSHCGEPLYVGRAHFAGTLTPGKVHPSHGCLYLPYGGGEHRVTSYEVLIRNDYYYRHDQAFKMAY